MEKFSVENMLLGEKLKEAIADSQFTTDEVADYIGITSNNLYRLYKKDSFEVKYLIKAAELLNLPLGYFLNDETIGAITQSATGQQVQQATRVGQNNQSINVGGMSQKECEEKLKDLQEKYDLARKSLIDKERIIKMLEGEK